MCKVSLLVFFQTKGKKTKKPSFRPNISLEKTNKRVLESYSFLFPMVLIIGIFIFLPIFGTIFLSFMKETTFLAPKFILFENYGQLFRNSAFWQSLRFTILFVVISVPLEVILGLMFALVLDQPLRFRGWIRALVLIPWVIPSAISARIWELIYNFHFGLANWLFTELGITVQPVNWLGTKAGAFFALIIADTWKTTPFVTIILLAGLQTIPNELHEQAKVDSANFLQRFWWITCPLLKPALAVAFLFRSIDSLRVFDLIYVLTSGGPGGGTTSLSFFSYKYFLLGDFGTGSAVSVLLFIIAVILSVICIRILNFREQLS